jgi:hypothetical protein
MLESCFAVVFKSGSAFLCTQIASGLLNGHRMILLTYLRRGSHEVVMATPRAIQVDIADCGATQRAHFRGQG